MPFIISLIVHSSLSAFPVLLFAGTVLILYQKCTFLQVFPPFFCITCINRDFRQSAFPKTVQFANEKGLPCSSPLFQHFFQSVRSVLSGGVIFRHLGGQIFQYVVGIPMFSVRRSVELDHVSAVPEHGIDVRSRSAQLVCSSSVGTAVCP